MSSTSIGSPGAIGESTNDVIKKNHPAAGGTENDGENDVVGLPAVDRSTEVVATSSVAAEAEQGDGPAAASAASSASGNGVVQTSVVSASASSDYAAAASDTVAVAVGPYGAAAAGPVGVAVVTHDGASAASNAANSCSTTVRQKATDLSDDRSSKTPRKKTSGNK